MLHKKLMLLMLVVPLAGCATIQRHEAKDTEQLLTVAGFQARPADTPEKLNTLKTMPPRKLLAREQEGQVVYTYADPDYCQCLYVGGPQEYSEYQQLAVQRESVEERQNAVTKRRMWGPWGW
ncbi:MAG TPA: hypothetical protein VIH59_04020 [Candidatus Tectomicrobia bacterium]|jgi:hypothetical protein